MAKVIERVCHYNKIFVTTEGDVFPCCYRRDYTKIGNLINDDIHTLIKNHHVPCKCGVYKSIAPTPDDKINIKMMNFELSRLCQSRCLMCFNDSPNWKGTYDLYPQLSDLIDTYKPETLVVQGGEVLVQKDSMKWLQEVKKKHPELKIQIVTNGCVDVKNADLYEQLFDMMSISFVGFQPATYNAIMGLDQEKTLALVNRLFEGEKVNVRLKHLDTPSTIHESHLFFEWAINKKPQKIYLHDVGLNEYIKPDASYNYWNKLFAIQAKKIQNLLIKYKDELKTKERYISFNVWNAKAYGITEEFLKEHSLENTVSIT